MPKKDDEILYLKHKDQNIMGRFSAIALLIALCLFILIQFSIIKVESDGGLGLFLNSPMAKILLIIFIIVFLLISLFDLIFYSDCDYHINDKTKTVHFITGKWKFKKEIILNFEQIKNIVLYKNVERSETEYGITKYKIDLYDNELNAYEIFESTNFDKISMIATGIEKITKIKVDDCTDVENYEGYIKRIL